MLIESWYIFIILNNPSPSLLILKKDNLKRDGVVHIFKLLSGKNDYAIISREDYIKSIKKLAQEHKDSIFGMYIYYTLFRLNY